MNLPRRAIPLVLGLTLLAGNALQLAAAGGPAAMDSSGRAATLPARADERVPEGAIPPKNGPEGLDGRLQRLFTAAQDDPGNIGLSAKAEGLILEGDLVQVVVECEPGTLPTVEQQVVALGGRAEARYESLLQAAVPPALLDRLSRAPGVLRVRTPEYPMPLATVSEGLQGMGLESWRNAGVRGGGAKVAVGDLGFDGYAALLGSDLPSRVTVRSFRQDGDITGGGDPHGTAAAEIVYDIAPDASFYLVNFATEVELGNAVDWLISQGVQLMSVSVGWPGTAFGDGRGTVNDIVRKADAAGILWVQGAGNFGQTHWSGVFTDLDGNGFHDFGANDEGNTITLRRTRPGAEQVYRVEIFLTWDDWETLTQDYDLFLFRGSAVVAQSTAFQNGKFPPVEHIVYTTAEPGDYWIAIQRFRTTRRARLDLVVTQDYGLEYRNASESLVVPADSPVALTVGAVEPGTLNLRPYSSQGPTKDGRVKPDLVAGDQVTTRIYGDRGFAGTSASTPHVAGAAALVKGARQDFTPALLRAFLLGRARGPGLANETNQVGAGLLFLGDLPGTFFFPIAVRMAPLRAP